VQLIVLRPKWAQVAFAGVETFKVLGSVVPVVNWQVLVLMNCMRADLSIYKMPETL